MPDFRDREIERLAGSGWSARFVRERGLPAITGDYLRDTFSPDEWLRAEQAVHALTEHFSSARFAEEVSYGVLLVPAPGLLDTRRALPSSVRADVFDERLPAGKSLASEHEWSLVATVTGAYGPALGSCLDVVNAPAEEFTVLGEDTRLLMIRQLWGARVLQSGETPPDCEHNARWTFTLFPGEPLVDGLAESGTVLKGKVRFRLGKADRGIGSARVAPALAISPSENPPGAGRDDC